MGARKIHTTLNISWELDDNGDMIFYDYPWAWNANVGDEVQHKTRYKTVLYVVVSVDPAEEPNFPKELRKVRARLAEVANSE
jgi:hypothetical protein